MNYRAVLSSKKWCFLLFLVFLCGCSSQQVYIEKHTDEWIARPLSELKQEMSSPDSYASKIGWKETTYPLHDGYYVFVEPVSSDCSIHWDINPRDKIIGYRAIGSGCVQKSAENPSSRSITTPTTRW